MAALAPVISQQVKRDREEELIHRGVQYSRAIKHFVKKLGRYPTRIEDLESANNMRFLRRRYKDPITGKDFKLLHLGEVQTSFNAGIQGASPAVNLVAGALAAGSPLAGGNRSGFGSSSFGNSSFGGQGGFGNNAPGGGAFGGNAPGGNASGGNSGGTGFTFGSGPDTGSGGMNAGQGTGTDNSQTGSNSGGNPLAPSNPQNQQGAGANQVFGGGPIVGVASTSKDKTIRVFSKKDHYYEWQFVYDPNSDRGGLLTTPNQPGQQGAGGALQGVQGGANPQNGPFGNPGSNFGQGNQPNPPGGMQPVPQPSPYPPMPPEQGPEPQ
jgi:type II secretory pathway pseudopilin PulG